MLLSLHVGCRLCHSIAPAARLLCAIFQSVASAFGMLILAISFMQSPVWFLMTGMTGSPDLQGSTQAAVLGGTPLLPSMLFNLLGTFNPNNARPSTSTGEACSLISHHLQ